MADLPTENEDSRFSTPANLKSSLHIDAGAAQKLSQSLARVQSGNTLIYRTPWNKHKDGSVILASFDEFFSDLTHAEPLDARLDQLELSQRDKFGPRSLAKPWSERKGDVHKYFGEYEGELDTIDISPPLAPTRHSLRQIKLKRALQSLKHGTSSGLPYMIKKELVAERIANQLSNKDSGDFYYKLLWREDPCVLYTRTQEQWKTRTVWGYPVADTLMELSYFIPILEAQKRLHWRSALLGPDEVDKMVTRAFLNSHAHNQPLMSIDFSLYDASVKPLLQSVAFSYLESMFQLTAESQTNFSLMRDRFAEIGLVTPDGVLKGSHGVPSGSTFTNEVDSIVQYAIANNFITLGSVQGDDGIYVTEDPERLIRRFNSFGLNVNEEKTDVSMDYCIFLQNYYSRSYVNVYGNPVGVYPLYRALNRLIYTERWTDFEDHNVEGRDYFSLRAISILENCKNHPFFVPFVKFVANSDKYNLKFSGMGFNKYTRMLNRVKGAGDLIRNQYGDDIRGLLSFQTVKVLRDQVW